MEIKQVHIAYFSPTGTTKRTLRAVAEGFGCSELSETDWADPKSRAALLKTGPHELVIAGMPVYYGRIPSPFQTAT
ncbi:MAG: 4Fe-4S ferredoxin, partial [Bilophila sp.]|nr:4Fe-4S ferredoxin [Bilophila sp.]